MEGAGIYISPTKDFYKPTVVVRRRPKKYREITPFVVSSPPSSPLSKPDIIPFTFGESTFIKETPSPKSIIEESPIDHFVPSYVPPPKKEKKNVGSKKAVKWFDSNDNVTTNNDDGTTHNESNNDVNVLNSPIKRSSPKKATKPSKLTSPKIEKSSSSSSSSSSLSSSPLSSTSLSSSPSKLATTIIKDMDLYSKHITIIGMLVLLLSLIVFSFNDFGLAKLYRGSYMSTESNDNVNINTVLKISIFQPVQSVPTLSSNLSFELSGVIFNDHALIDQEEKVLTLNVTLDGKLIQFPGGNSLSITNLQGPLNVASDLKEHGLTVGSRKITIHAIISNNDKGKKKALKQKIEYSLIDYTPTNIIAEAKDSVIFYYIDELMNPVLDYSDPLIDVFNVENQVTENENDIRILLPKNNSRIHEGDQLRVKLAPHYVKSPSLKVTVLFDKREFDVTEFARKQLPLTGKEMFTIFTIDINGITKGEHLLEIIATAIVNDEEISCYDFTSVVR